MKRRRIETKLKLSRETLRNISEHSLQKIAAGAPTDLSCEPSCPCSHFNNNTCNTNCC